MANKLAQIKHTHTHTNRKGKREKKSEKGRERCEWLDNSKNHSLQSLQEKCNKNLRKFRVSVGPQLLLMDLLS